MLAVMRHSTTQVDFAAGAWCSMYTYISRVQSPQSLRRTQSLDSSKAQAGIHPHRHKANKLATSRVRPQLFRGYIAVHSAVRFVVCLRDKMQVLLQHIVQLTDSLSCYIHSATCQHHTAACFRCSILY